MIPTHGVLISYSDHRIALENAVITWLAELN